MKYAVVIPARLLSTRLPEKPLIDLLGKSMIRRTWEQCLKAVAKQDVFIATDSLQIKEHVESFGGQCIMTSAECLTGTDRIAEFAQKVKVDYYINVQGDEPLMNPEDILKIIEAINQYDGEIINGYGLIEKEDDFKSASVPKVVFRNDGRLLYMSRAAIPGNKSGEFISAYRQICVYAFPSDALEAFSKVKSKTYFENIEDIEILRFLELGYDVRMIELSTDSIAVDNPEDVKKVINKLKLLQG
jgi:3-deoxy-manno-octulosonate cytidylyltransferase (CMP-KDO synthetase)